MLRKTAFASLFEPRNVVLFLVAAFCLGVMGNALYGFCLALFPKASAPILNAALFVVFGLGLFGLSAVVLGRFRSLPEGKVGSHSALVVFVSKDGTSHQTSIDFHLKSGLKHLWLLASHESQAIADTVRLEYQRTNQWLSIELPIQIDPTDPNDAETAIRRIVEAAQFKSLNLVVDVTGGPKPWSLGAIKVCAEKLVSVQYILQDQKLQPQDRVRYLNRAE